MPNQKVLISVDDARRRRRAYFRCTHKHDQQCAAQRQVQRRDDDPDAYTVTYIGAHTCRDPATAADDELHAGSRLISFAAANAATTTGNASNRQAGHKGAVLPAEPPRQLEGGARRRIRRSSAPSQPGSPAQTEAATHIKDDMVSLLAIDLPVIEIVMGHPIESGRM